MIRKDLSFYTVCFFNMDDGPDDTIEAIVNILNSRITANDGTGSGTLVQDAAIIASEVAEGLSNKIVASVVTPSLIIFTRIGAK